VGWVAENDCNTRFIGVRIPLISVSTVAGRISVRVQTGSPIGPDTPPTQRDGRRVLRFARHDITDQIDTAESSEPTERNEPTANREPKDPTDPTDRAEPTEPIERTEPLDAMERIESSDAIDHRDRPPSCDAIAPTTHLIRRTS